MIRAQKCCNRHREVTGNDRKDNKGPTAKPLALEFEVRKFASRKDTPRIARLGDGCLDERAEVPTALQLVLNPCAPTRTQLLAPLCVDFALEIQSSPTIRSVTRRDKKTESDPAEESVPCEEATVVAQNACPANDASQDAHGCGYGAQHELDMVPQSNNVGMFEYIEPDEQACDECRESI
jgi:hypothetical protein